MARVPRPEDDSWGSYWAKIAPGFLFCLALGALARWIESSLIPEDLFVVNYVLIAILLGLAARNLAKIPPVLEDGIEFSAKICLFIGIVLLGAGLNLGRIFTLGGMALIMVTGSITLSIVLCGWLARRIGAGERWGHLVGAGIGVCGVSAIIALAPAIKAREKEILTAIGAALLTDMVVLLGLPSLAHPLEWSDMLVGFMAGVVPSNTAQCIAIGHAYSDAAGAIATVVKSARNALLPVVILVLTYIYTARGLPVGERASLGLLWSKFPKFIVGLLIAATLATVGLITPAAAESAGLLSSWFFVICFVAIGAGINVRSLGGQDASVIGFGFLMTAVLGIYAYLFSRFLLSL